VESGDRKMRILSLFDGMACGMIAFKVAGVPIDSYDAYEIDKFAVQVATHNFPEIRERKQVYMQLKEKRSQLMQSISL
jgi:DNA (cytosine-5)-methyltransferase 3A